MAFWKATALINRNTEEKKTFVVQAPDEYTADKIRSAFMEVHTEYLELELAQIEKPSWIRAAYGEEDPEALSSKEIYARAQAQRGADEASSKKRRSFGKS